MGPVARALRLIQRALDAAGLPAVPPPTRLQELPEIDLEQVASRPQQAPIIITDRQSLPPRENAEHDDLGAMLRIVSHLEPQVVLELGTAYGNATANICANSYAHVYTVNAEPRQLRSRTPTQFILRGQIGEVYRRHGFEQRVTQIIGDTLEVDLPARLQGRRVDLAIIDACHDPRHVIRDFHAVQQVLRHGAVVLLHDTHPSGFKHLWGSTRACRRLRCHGFDIRHIYGTWWGYWRKSRIEDFKRAVADIARRFTARLGVARRRRQQPPRDETITVRQKETSHEQPKTANPQEPISQENTYLFVLSPPFSGSTLLWKLLATSPHASALPREGQFLPEVRQWMAPNRWDPDKPLPWEQIKERWRRGWDTSKSILLEKSPAHIVRAEQIEQHFQPAFFIAMVRNPYALCQGLRRRQGRSGETAARMWVTWARYQMHNIRRLKRVISFTYEQLTEDPAETRSRILAFLPQLEDIDIDRPFEAESYLGRSARPIRNLNQAKIDMLPPDYIRRVNEVLRLNEDVMRFFGYSIMEPSVVHRLRHGWACCRHRVGLLAGLIAPHPPSGTR
ncbi:MAG: CmcI family methyltransferase [Planctomycetota bacterium]